MVHTVTFLGSLFAHSDSWFFFLVGGTTWVDESCKHIWKTYSSQVKNSWRNKCHIACHIHVMESFMNFVHKCIKLDGWDLMVVFKEWLFVMSYNNGKKFAFQFTLLWIDFNKMWSMNERCPMCIERTLLLGLVWPEIFNNALNCLSPTGTCQLFKWKIVAIMLLSCFISLHIWICGVSH